MGPRNFRRVKFTFHTIHWQRCTNKIAWNSPQLCGGYCPQISCCLGWKILTVIVKREACRFSIRTVNIDKIYHQHRLVQTFFISKMGWKFHKTNWSKRLQKKFPTPSSKNISTQIAPPSPKKNSTFNHGKKIPPCFHPQI